MTKAVKLSDNRMPLQNRVTPTGDIVATPHRGLFTGNRGIIHDPATKTLLKKRWSSPESRDSPGRNCAPEVWC
jgi:hypothetical protein